VARLLIRRLQLALVQWREHMFANLYDKNNKLVNAVLQQIENHRNGEEVDTTLLKGVIESFGTSPFPPAPTRSHSSHTPRPRQSPSA
jgi:hypothetical protein